MEKIKLPELSRFKLHKTSNMFGGWGYLVKDGVCAECGRKLKLSRDKKFGYCSGIYRGRWQHKSKKFKLK